MAKKKTARKRARKATRKKAASRPGSAQERGKARKGSRSARSSKRSEAANGATSRPVGASASASHPLPAAWPAAAIEPRHVADLTPYARNARTHSPAQVDQIARSIEEFGWTAPVLVDPDGGIVAGHGRVLAAAQLGIESVPTMVARGWTEAQRRAYVIADNQLALNAGWDEELLGSELEALGELDFDLTLTGFEEQELGRLVEVSAHSRRVGAGDVVEDEAPKPEDDDAAVVSKRGDLWLLGRHRVLCGDATSEEDVAAVMGGEVATLIHADPPYGMGKQREGVTNDNLYREKLDAFQMAWWRACRGLLAENGSAYIWGNAPELWRLWWIGGLADEGDLMARNEIVWDKGHGMGMNSDGEHSYVTATERCLFLMRGQQFLGNQNKDDYWEGWEPLRAWLVEQRDLVGWKAADINRITGTQMHGHWFSRSQFQPIGEKDYDKLQVAADGKAFEPSYADLFVQLFPGLLTGGGADRHSLSAQLREQRTHFDNTHDTMTDVWRFPRVHGEERHGHATPKPVGMVARALLSSSREGDVALAPFGGSGPEFIAAEQLSRRCFGLEIEPRYVDVIVKRWEKFTGEQATHAETGRTFAEMEEERVK